MTDKRICDHCNLPVVICNARYSIGVATDQGYDLADILPETGTPKREKSDHAELIERLRGVMSGWRIGDETEAALDAAVAEISAVFDPLHRENTALRAEVERLREVEVLPLVWDDDWADTPFCSYGIRCEWDGDNCGPFWWQRSEYPFHFETDERFDTIDDAKASAQADYASRIRAALGHTQGGR